MKVIHSGEFLYAPISNVPEPLNPYIYLYIILPAHRNVTTENLRYLTVDQALADMANFIPYIKSKYIPTGVKYAPVVLVGYQYGGGLVAWFRQKYPHLVAGVWSSSAMLYAKIDNYAYNEIVGDVYRQIGGADCYHHIENGFRAMDEMIANNQSAELSGRLGLCHDMGTGIGASTFFSYFSQLFGSELQIRDK